MSNNLKKIGAIGSCMTGSIVPLAVCELFDDDDADTSVIQKLDQLTEAMKTGFTNMQTQLQDLGGRVDTIVTTVNQVVGAVNDMQDDLACQETRLNDYGQQIVSLKASQQADHELILKVAKKLGV